MLHMSPTYQIYNIDSLFSLPDRSIKYSSVFEHLGISCLFRETFIIQYFGNILTKPRFNF